MQTQRKIKKTCKSYFMYGFDYQAKCMFLEKLHGIKISLGTLKSRLAGYGLYHCGKSAQIQSFFWSLFSCIRTEYGELLRKSLYWVQIQENTGQKQLHIIFGHFSRSAQNCKWYIRCQFAGDNWKRSQWPIIFERISKYLEKASYDIRYKSLKM